MHNKTKKYKLKPIEIEDPSIVFIKHVVENKPNASFAKHFFTIFFATSWIKSIIQELDC